MKPKSYGGHPLNLIISGSIYDSFIITSSKMFFNGPFPASFSVCSSFQNSWQYWLNTNFLQWLDSNHGPLESEAIALPSEPQPLPQVWLLVGSPRLVTKKSVVRCLSYICHILAQQPAKSTIGIYPTKFPNAMFSQFDISSIWQYYESWLFCFVTNQGSKKQHSII